MTQQEVLESLQHDNPNHRFALSDDGQAIGVWSDYLGRFRMLVGEAVNGMWVHLPHEFLINGRPPYAPEQWIEV